MCECMCVSVHHVCMHVGIGEGLVGVGSLLSFTMQAWIMAPFYVSEAGHQSLEIDTKYGQAISLLFIPKVSRMSKESVEWGSGRGLV